MLLADSIRIGELSGVAELARVAAVARRTRAMGPQTDRELGIVAQSDGQEIVVRYTSRRCRRRRGSARSRRDGGGSGGGGGEEAGESDEDEDEDEDEDDYHDDDRGE